MESEPEILKLQTRLLVGKLQILSSHGELFNHVDSGGPMWTGSGDRNVEVPIVFLTPFAALPQITFGLTGVDNAHDQNLRIHLATEKITTTGFTLVCSTWDDTHIARVSATWQALGPI